MINKHVFLIGGTMGIGKTTVCQILKERLDNAVYFDGDWAWDLRPLTVNEETKAMALDNVNHVLNNFIHCSCIENIIFCWVMHRQHIIDNILSNLDQRAASVINISLVCSEEELIRRFSNDVLAGSRKMEHLPYSLYRIPLYHELNTIKIDVTDLTPEDTAKAILKLI